MWSWLQCIGLLYVLEFPSLISEHQYRILNDWFCCVRTSLHIFIQVNWMFKWIRWGVNHNNTITMWLISKNIWEICKLKMQVQVEAAYQTACDNKLFWLWVVGFWMFQFDQEVLWCPPSLAHQSVKFSAVLIFRASLESWVCEQWQTLPACCRSSLLSAGCFFFPLLQEFLSALFHFQVGPLYQSIQLPYYDSWLCVSASSGDEGCVGSREKEAFLHSAVLGPLKSHPPSLMHVSPYTCLSSSPPSPHPWFPKT